ncbi:MAG: Gfo/Idh/MocA family oxidoreductase [Acidobacteria bacterium]|nr:Gfo/Idh/MocA family oxidoreductase [Acidobacteriota bacterium]
MNLTPELKEQGRRNFLKALAGVPAVAALGATAAVRGPIHGGPVKAALIGAGGEGRVLLGQCRKEFINLKAICDINPDHAQLGSETIVKAGYDKPAMYQDWREMLQKEDLEAVIIATPLWTHAEITVGCLEAGKHVLCEKMMAWDIEGCQRMLDASRKNRRLLEIGYQRFYNPMYQATYEALIKTGALGDIYHARLAWHRNQSWRRAEQPPSPDFDPRKWGYANWEHLVNWRLYKKYSRGLLAELGSHQIGVTSWFFDSAPRTVYGSGGTYQYKDGREVDDHIYVIFEYPQGRTVTFSTIQSNKFDDFYEMIMGTRGTLILKGETEAFLFNEEGDKAVNVEASNRAPGRASSPVMDASESRIADAAGRKVTDSTDQKYDRLASYRLEISDFCGSIRTGTPLRCGPERALVSAATILSAYESIEKKTRIEIPIYAGE